MPSVFVQNLEAAAKLTELVLGNMEGIARASQSIAQFGVGGGATLVIGETGGAGGGAQNGTETVGMGSGGGGGGKGVVYYGGAHYGLQTRGMGQGVGGTGVQSRDAAAIVGVLQSLPGAIARELNKNSLGNILRSTGGL